MGGSVKSASSSSRLNSSSLSSASSSSSRDLSSGLGPFWDGRDREGGDEGEEGGEEEGEEEEYIESVCAGCFRDGNGFRCLGEIGESGCACEDSGCSAVATGSATPSAPSATDCVPSSAALRVRSPRAARRSRSSRSSASTAATLGFEFPFARPSRAVCKAARRAAACLRTSSSPSSAILSSSLFSSADVALVGVCTARSSDGIAAALASGCGCEDFGLGGTAGASFFSALRPHSRTAGSSRSPS